jgi:hypothetical protein
LRRDNSLDLEFSRQVQDMSPAPKISCRRVISPIGDVSRSTSRRAEITRPRASYLVLARDISARVRRRAHRLIHAAIWSAIAASAVSHAPPLLRRHGVARRPMAEACVSCLSCLGVFAGVLCILSIFRSSCYTQTNPNPYRYIPTLNQACSLRAPPSDHRCLSGK